jgi:serine/threonine protein kinase
VESLDSSPSSRATDVASLRDEPEFRSRSLEVEDVLGEGGSAIVYRARDERHSREVAVKVIRHDAALGNAAERFAQELRVAAGLRHAHIMPVYDSGVLRDGRAFLVMPMAQGRPLRAMISEGPLAIADAVRLALEIAEALAYLHKSGYVHRDVKPGNILVEAGHAVLTDFGLATPAAPVAAPAYSERSGTWTISAGSERITEAGRLVGTLVYMSPEALLGSAPIDERSDIYSLGIVLYEMLTGDVPFDAPTPTQLMAQRVRAELPSISSLRPDVSRELEEIVVRCTAVQPEARFATADALIAALAAIATGANGQRARLLTRDRAPWSIGLVAVLVGLIIGASLWYKARQASALDPQRIVVADLANDTGDSALASVGALAGDFIAGALTADGHLTVVNATVSLPSRLQRGRLPPDSTIARQTRDLIHTTRAGLAVTGAYFRVESTLEIVAEVIDTRSGRVLGVAGPVRGVPAALDSSLRVLGDSVAAISRRRFAPPA